MQFKLFKAWGIHDSPHETRVIVTLGGEGGIPVSPQFVGGMFPTLDKTVLPPVIPPGMEIPFHNSKARWTSDATYLLDRSYTETFTTPEKIGAVLYAMVGQYEDLLDLLWVDFIVGIYRKEQDGYSDDAKRISKQRKKFGSGWLDLNALSTCGEVEKHFEGKTSDGHGIVIHGGLLKFLNEIERGELVGNQQWVSEIISSCQSPVDPGVVSGSHPIIGTGQCYIDGYTTKEVVYVPETETPLEEEAIETMLCTSFRSLPEIPSSAIRSLITSYGVHYDYTAGSWAHYGAGYDESRLTKCKSKLYANAWIFADEAFSAVLSEGVSCSYSPWARRVSVMCKGIDKKLPISYAPPENPETAPGLTPLLTGIGALGHFGGIDPLQGTGIKIWDFLGDDER